MCVFYQWVAVSGILGSIIKTNFNIEFNKINIESLDDHPHNWTNSYIVFETIQQQYWLQSVPKVI